MYQLDLIDGSGTKKTGCLIDFGLDYNGDHIVNGIFFLKEVYQDFNYDLKDDKYETYLQHSILKKIKSEFTYHTEYRLLPSLFHFRH